MNATSWALVGMNIVLCGVLLYQNKLGQDAVRNHIATVNDLATRPLRNQVADLLYTQKMAIMSHLPLKLQCGSMMAIYVRPSQPEPSTILACPLPKGHEGNHIHARATWQNMDVS